MNYYALIVAGGSGSRMKTDIPKQFLIVAGKPVLMHTIEAFHESDFNPSIVLVLPPGFHEYWKQLCTEFAFRIPHLLANGGEQRFASVKNGLDLISNDGIIAVHDAVRPMISNEVISESYRVAGEKGSAVTAIASRDSVRKAADGRNFAIDRDSIFLVQTPQTFPSAILKKAYQLPYSMDFTDDASVVETSGIPITLIHGSTQNIKITFAEDLILAEHFLSKKKSGHI